METIILFWKEILNVCLTMAKSIQNVRRELIKFHFFLFFSKSGLNEELVQLLLIRDELHTEQDAMLVDIEDLTRLVSVSIKFC